MELFIGKLPRFAFSGVVVLIEQGNFRAGRLWQESMMQAGREQDVDGISNLA